MTITVTEDFRNFKAGDVIDFTGLEKFQSITVVGENGCGKSTILQALRGQTGKTTSLYKSDFEKLGKNVKIEHSYENVLFFDAVKDNGNDFMVGFDAVNYVNAGGFATKNLSHGQGALYYISKFLQENEKNIVPGKTLLVFDEIDNGLSLQNMSKFVNFIHKMMYERKCHVLIASHNPFFIVQSYICYDMEEKKLKSSQTYVKEATGFTVTKKTKPEESHLVDFVKALNLVQCIEDHGEIEEYRGITNEDITGYLNTIK